MANLNVNSVIMGGRLVKDPELKTTPNGISVTTFSIAVNRRTKAGEEQKADFFNVTAWRGTADTVCKYFRKGSCILVRGSVQNRSYEKEGATHYVTEILADEVFFVDSKNESPAPAQQNAQAPVTYIPDAYTQTQARTDAPKLTVMSTDDELPFD